MNGSAGSMTPLGHNVALSYLPDINRPEAGHCLLSDMNTAPVSHFSSHCHSVQNSTLNRHRADYVQGQQASGKREGLHQRHEVAPVPAPRNLLRCADQGSDNLISTPVPAPRNLLDCAGQGSNHPVSTPVPAPRNVEPDLKTPLLTPVPALDEEKSAPSPV